jgi:hypothetical protein
LNDSTDVPCSNLRYKLRITCRSHIRHCPSRSLTTSLVLALGTLLLSCGCHRSAVTDSRPLVNAAAPLVTPTYDGSGQAMHPGIVYIPNGWHGFQYWLVVTPYTNGDASTEYPSILASNDGISWTVPYGLTNPVVYDGKGDLADGDLFYDTASDELWMYYIDKGFSGDTHLLRKTSPDGVRWGVVEDLFAAPNYQIVSPAIEKIGDTYYLWSVNTGIAGYKATSSTVEWRISADGKTWSAPQVASIIQAGYVLWHIDATYIPPKNEIWMVAAAYPTGTTSGQTVLFFAKSTDGINWTTYGKKALGPGSTWDDAQIYRSTLLYDPVGDILRIWYSARGGQEWHTGYTQARLTDFLAWLQQ